jgi:plasmid stabilization system protein ParE
VIQVLVASAAYADLEESVAYYERIHAGLGGDLLTNFEAAVEQVARQPQLAHEIEPGLLWVRLHRFPFKVIYRLSSDRAVVLAVLHHRRDPAIRQRRTI